MGARADLLIAGALLMGGGVVASLEPARQLSVARGIRGTVLLPIVRVHESFATRARLGARLEQLRAERDELAAQNLELRQLAGQGSEARRLLNLGTATPVELVAADLIPGRPRLGDSDVFMLRGPAVSRLRAPAGVLTGAGLVGVLRAADRRGGKGDFWSHPDFRVSVRTEEGGTTGIVRAVRRGDGPPLMLLEGAPYQEEIPPGVVLLTTGLAGIYPPGVRVGTVIAVSEVESGWAKSYLVKPAVRPGLADVVLVWRRPVVIGAGSPPGGS
ncbi:MAG: rod shape-determining protein MreC [Gemmatimonadota bacterium]